MPGKSRHGKVKHHHRSKKSKAKQRHDAMTFQPPAAVDTPQPAAAISTPPSAKTPTPPPAAPRMAQYPYITKELRRIGILAGIILVILIVLALVLS